MADLRAFQQLLGDLDQAMVVVTTAVGPRRSGCLVGFSSQASISPPRFLALLSDQNHTYRLARGADALAVHLLGPEELPLACLFGTETTDEVDKFADCRWHEGPAGMPILEDCPAWFVGRILHRYRTGDHVGHLLAPIAASRRSAVQQPLRLRDVSHLEAGHAP
jgi:flavin reductase (DIM6/NTAB) family NADH-FMN oxidoreductase RutF